MKDFNVLENDVVGTREELQKAVLALSPNDRELIALAAWESLDLESSATVDDEWLAVAATRDQEIELGHVQMLTFDEFKRQTDG